MSGLSRLVPSPTQPGGLGPPSPALRVRVLAGITLCVFIVALAGCGKRNAPTAPPDVPDTYPRAYPSE
jgi:hypothetical protein